MISILFIGLYLVTFQVTCEGAPGPKIIIQNDVEKRANEYISILAYIHIVIDWTFLKTALSQVTRP